MADKMRQELGNQTTSAQRLLEMRSEMDLRENQYSEMEVFKLKLLNFFFFK